MTKATPAASRRKAKTGKLDDASARARSRRLSRGAANATATSKPADRRSEILLIAARRFAKFGFEATTIRQIADDAHILSGSIYHHFETKDEILESILHDTIVRMRDTAIGVSNSNADAEVKLTSLVLLSLEGLERDKEAHTILYNERKLLGRSEHLAPLKQCRFEMYQVWSEVHKQGMESGLFKNMDTFLAISTITRIVNTSAEWFNNQDQDYYKGLRQDYGVDQIIDFNLEFILSAIRHESREGEPIPRQASADLIDSLG